MEVSVKKFKDLLKYRADFIIGICWICMALFLYTAYAKIVDHNRFLQGLEKVNIINGYATFLSFAIPFVEAIVALLLLVPKTALAGLYSFITAMSVFELYIISALIWEKKLPCACGGIIENLSWKQHLWFNLAFIIIAIIAILLINSPNTLKNYKK